MPQSPKPPDDERRSVGHVADGFVGRGDDLVDHPEPMIAEPPPISHAGFGDGEKLGDVQVRRGSREGAAGARRAGGPRRGGRQDGLDRADSVTAGLEEVRQRRGA